MSASRCDVRWAVATPHAFTVSGPAEPDGPPSTSDGFAAEEIADTVQETARGAARLLRKHWQIPVAVIMLGLAYLSLRGHLPSLHAVGEAATSANLTWILIAAACEAVSLGMFARQQRTLLSAVGVRISAIRALGVTYARSALAFSMPAGSAVSAGFAFQQYRRSGAANDKAAAVMVLSGVISFLGLAVLYVTGVLGLLVAQPSRTIAEHPVLLGLVAAALIASITAWIWRWRSSRRPADEARRGRRQRQASGWKQKITNAAADTVEAWRSIRVRDWSAAGAFAIFNWLLDLLCLIAAAQAFRLPVGIGTIAALYLGAQVIRQLPLTPGGIGLIETTLLTGLVSAGASPGPAAAAVLAYRILSCWLIIPIGGLAYLGLRKRPVATAA